MASEFLTNVLKLDRGYAKSKPNFGGFVVIGAGLPRTGTLSLQTALTILLNGACYHMYALMSSKASDPDIGHWNKALTSRVRQLEWINFFEGRGFRAGVDFPVARFYKEIMAAYPDAKVILTTRDPIKWYHSVKTTIYQTRILAKNPINDMCAKLVGHWQHLDCCLKISKELFDVIESGEDASVKFYNNWVEEVKNAVPKNKLLVFQVSSGWEPLCEFLGLPQPKQPFPNVNDSASMKRTLARMGMIPKIFMTCILSLIFALIYNLI